MIFLTTSSAVIAGLNASAEKKTVTIDLTRFAGQNKTEIVLAADGPTADSFDARTLPAAGNPVLTVTMDKDGGFTALIR